MLFQQKPVTFCISMIYGFETQDKETYDFVLTLQRKCNVTIIHGMLSKISFISIYKDLWIFLSRVVKTSNIEFEVVAKHYPAYKQIIPIYKVHDTVSFDGYATKTIIVKRSSILKKLTLQG